MTTPPWKDKAIFCFTSDVDWASEAALKRNQTLFDRFGIPLTYFVTHESPYLASLRQKDRVTLEAHPNFMPGSSHGESLGDVVDTIRAITPGARCYRNHRYYDVTDSSTLLRDKGFTYDSNHFSFLYKSDPFVHFTGTVRFPVFWEDGTHLYRKLDLDFKSFRDCFAAPGLTVIDTHPMHMVINSPSFEYTKKVKSKLSRAQWNDLNEVVLNAIEYEGPGIRNFVVDLLTWVRDENCTVASMADLYALFLEHQTATDSMLLT